jgi:hypothetical protein
LDCFSRKRLSLVWRQGSHTSFSALLVSCLSTLSPPSPA